MTPLIKNGRPFGRQVIIDACRYFGLRAKIFNLTVPHHHVSTRQIAKALSAERGYRYAKIWEWILLIAWGPLGISIAGYVVARSIDLYLNKTTQYHETWLIALAVSVAWGFVFAILAGVILKIFYPEARASQHASASEYARAADARPVLFLREFSDDGLGLNLHDDIDFLDSMAAVLNSFGPLVAIRGPRAKKSAVIKYDIPADDQWQSRVTDWMDNAKLVVISVGRTQGLTWEVNQLVAGGHLHKVIVLRPPLEHFRNRVAITGGRSHLREEVSQTLCRFLEPFSNCESLDKTEMHDILAVHFDKAGNTVCIKGCGDRVWHYSDALSLAVYGVLSAK